MEVKTVQPETTIKTKIGQSTLTFQKLEHSIYSALEVYSNVHRGSGFNSLASTEIFDRARKVILEFLGLKASKHAVIFCTPQRADNLIERLNPNDYKAISSKDFCLSLGVVALIVKKTALPKGIPPEVGGGTTRLISREWVIWAEQPDRYEAGTPALINIIAFVKAIILFQEVIHAGSESQSNKINTKDLLYSDNLIDYKGLELLKKLRQTQIGNNLKVPTTQGLKHYINLDNAASTPTFEPIWKVFKSALIQPLELQKDLLDESKKICSGFLGAPADKFDIIYTSNTTESINIAAKHVRINKDNLVPITVITLLEHSSNDLPWRSPGNDKIVRLTIDKEGFINLAELEGLLSLYNEKQEHGNKRIQLVAVTGASNVLGVCQDIRSISQLVHKYGAFVLVDAAQLVAHRKIDMNQDGIDLLAFSAHKMYAPFGAGALIAKKGTLGLEQEKLAKTQASGEENVAGIAALAKSINLLDRIGMDLIEEEEKKLTEKLVVGLRQITGARIYGPTDTTSKRFNEKLGVTAFSISKMYPPKIANQLSLHGGIGIRTGCLCSHLLVKHILNVGPGLEKFQKIIQILFPKLKLPGIIRISLGLENTMEDVEQAVSLLKQITEKSAELPKSNINLAQKQVRKKIDDICTVVLE